VIGISVKYTYIVKNKLKEEEEDNSAALPHSNSKVGARK